MWKELVIHGEASKKKISIALTPIDLNTNLLIFLRSNNIPIASSCSGEGVCEKCIVSKEILSCRFTVNSYLEIKGNIVNVSYL